jgi:hypothetical protein
MPYRWFARRTLAFALAMAVTAPAALPLRAATLDAEVKRLAGHKDAVTAAAFSPDGKFLVTGSADKSAVLWDVAEGKAVRRFDGHANAVDSIAFSRDGNRIATGSIDRTARVWDVKNGALLANLAGGHTGHVHAIAISADGTRVLTGGCDHTAVLWDVGAEKAIATLDQPGFVRALDFAPDGKSFLVGNVGIGGRTTMTLRLYAAAGGPPTAEHKLPPVRGAAFLDGGKTVLAHAGSAVWRLDLTGGKSTSAQRAGAAGPNMDPWAASPDGRTCLFGGMMATQFVDAATGRTLAQFSSDFADQVRAVAISPDGQLGVIAGGGRGTPWENNAGRWTPARNTDVRVVHLANAAAATANRRTVRPPASRPSTVVRRTSHDGKRALTLDATAATWTDVATGAEIARVNRPRQSARPAIAPDAGRVVFWDDAGQVYAAGPGAAALKHLFRADGFEIGAIRFAHDGQSLWVASAGPPGASSAGTSTARRTPRPNDPPFEGPKIAPPDARAYGIFRWDLAAANWSKSDDAVKSGVHSFLETPDQRTLLAITDGLPDVPPVLHAWDAVTDKPLWTREITGTDPRWLGSRWFGYHAVVLNADGTRGVWRFGDVAGAFDVRTGKALARFDRQKSLISALALDPDGKRVWTIGNDDAIRAYDLNTGEVLRTVPLNGLSVTGARLVLTPERRVAELTTMLNGREERNLGD